MEAMTGDTKKQRHALDRLADALVDDIINTPDDDILAEITEEYGDTDKLAADMRTLFENTVQEAGKAKLAAAKRAVNETRGKGATVLGIDEAKARRRYEDILAADKELSDKLTMAARKGEGQSKRDIMYTIEDLAELGVFDDEEDNDK
jgi:hypothetical protein